MLHSTSRRLLPVTPPTKLTPPPTPSLQVQRTLLCNALCNVKAPRVSLVRAPAGFGKSTLMQQVHTTLREEGVAVSWLNLDTADNDISRMLRFLFTALQAIDGSCHDIERGIAVGTLALDLLDRVSSLPAPFVLFIDDLEVLQNPVALAFVRQLIDRLPAGGRLIAGSRALPDIGLSRLRGRGALMEVDSALLRFSVTETDLFFQQKCGFSLQQNEVEKLHKTTEGWAVGLWLASLVLERRSESAVLVEGFSGASAVVADYLSEEVLSQQPKRLRNFMLRTSILPLLNASLCDAVCDSHDGQAVLEELERANLFLIPLDNEREWFRYHSLFAVFLRAQLERKMPEELPRLHRAASNWYLRQKRIVPAIEQALQSKDMAFALPLFARHAERLLGEGRARLLARLLDTVPQQALCQWPQLQVVHIWAVAFTRGAADAMTLLSDYESNGGFTRRNDDDREDEITAHAMALRPMLLSILDRHDEAYEFASRNIDRLPARFTFPHAILRTSLAYVALVMGKYNEAQALLDEGRSLKVVDSSPFTMVFAQCVEGAIDMLQGRLRQATARFQLAAGIRGRRRSSSGNTFSTNGNAMAGILLAEVMYESGNLAKAERLLQVYVPLMREQGVPDHLISGHRNLARILYRRGELDSSLQTIAELEYLGHRNQLPRLIASACLERSRLAVLEGDRQASREELQRARTLGNWDNFSAWSLFGSDLDTPTDMQLRWQIHFGCAATAAQQLRDLVEEAETAKRYRRALKLRLLRALALYRDNNTKAALRLLRQILRTAAAEHYVQLILDEGDLILQLLGKLADSQQTQFDDTNLNNPRDLFARLAEGLPLTRPTPLVTNTESEWFEQLTRKESEVLHLLAEGLSNAAIGGRMFVSANTVRTHLRNINAKLHAQSRMEAVAVARRAGLLE